MKLLVQGGSIEEMKKLRDSKKEQVERDRKTTAEVDLKADKEIRRKAGGSDPMGQTGPVTA